MFFFISFNFVTSSSVHYSDTPHFDFLYLYNVHRRTWSLTLVSPGGPRHGVGPVSGDLEEQPQKHSQHAKRHIRLWRLRNCEVSSVTQKVEMITLKPCATKWILNGDVDTRDLIVLRTPAFKKKKRGGKASNPLPSCRKLAELIHPLLCRLVG